MDGTKIIFVSPKRVSISKKAVIMTTMTNTPESFWTKMARSYAARPISDVENYEATLARTQSYLGAEDSVLEIGAGTSSTALRLAPGVARYLATDYSQGMTEIAREKAFEASIPGLEVRQAGLGDAGIGSGPFDAVLAFNLLHLLPDLRGDLERIAALLPKGGLFISKTVCLGGQWYLRPVIGAMQLFGKAPFVGFLRGAALDAAIVGAGFELIETGDYGARGRSRYVVARKL